MVDDLITLGTQEPYRMFTSRAEHRLILREDNADLRLTEKARELGLIDDARWQAFNDKKEAIAKEEQRLKTTWVQVNSEQANALVEKIKTPLTREYNLMELLKRPELTYADLGELFLQENAEKNPQVTQQIEISIKYAGYIKRQEEEVKRLLQHEETPLPIDFDYSTVEGLSNEAKQKLIAQKPESLGRASRIQGITPAAISLLLVYLKKRGLLRKIKAK
jgi:tRNA uridine 5-carboxymethylaminomethyl modification enzyme